MEFDADWIWFAIVAGVIIVRALGSMISRASKRVAGSERPSRGARLEGPTVASAPGPAEFRRPDDAKPIEPR